MQMRKRVQIVFICYAYNISSLPFRSSRRNCPFFVSVCIGSICSSLGTAFFAALFPITGLLCAMHYHCAWIIFWSVFFFIFLSFVYYCINTTVEMFATESVVFSALRPYAMYVYNNVLIINSFVCRLFFCNFS